MKLLAQVAVGLTAGALSTQVIASPLTIGRNFDLETRDTHAQLMTVAGRQSLSDMEYDTWVNKMVDDGKMYWSNNATEMTLQAGTATYVLRKVACGIVGGNHQQYEEGRDHFCQLINQAVQAHVLGATYIMQNGVCQGNENCDFIIETSFGAGGAYAKNSLPSICDKFFDAIWNDCNGNVGGSAQVTLTDNAGTQNGRVNAQFYAHDAGATCPANTKHNICGKSTF